MPGTNREQRRYEISKELLPFFLEQTYQTASLTDSKMRQISCAAAIETADLLLDELEKPMKR